MYLVNNTVNRSVLKVSKILLPDAPFQSVSLVGVSPLVDQITIRRKVRFEYLSLNSSIIVKFTPA